MYKHIATPQLVKYTLERQQRHIQELERVVQRLQRATKTLIAENREKDLTIDILKAQMDNPYQRAYSRVLSLEYETFRLREGAQVIREVLNQNSPSPRVNQNRAQKRDIRPHTYHRYTPLVPMSWTPQLFFAYLI